MMSGMCCRCCHYSCN